MLTTTLLVTQQNKSEQLETLLQKLKEKFDWNNVSATDADLTIVNEEGDGIKIATVRKLITDASFKPYARKQRAVLLLNLEQASLPAQQALLKYFEEPPEYLNIIATTNNLSAILPTIQSRCSIEYIQQEAIPQISQEVQEWIQNLDSVSYADIVAISAQYKDREQAINFLRQCLIGIRNNSNFPGAFLVDASQIMLTSLDYLQRNANTRLTLEDCFFTIKNRF